MMLGAHCVDCKAAFSRACVHALGRGITDASETRLNLRIAGGSTVAILAQGTSWADADPQAFFGPMLRAGKSNREKPSAPRAAESTKSAESSQEHQECRELPRAPRVPRARFESPLLVLSALSVALGPCKTGIQSGPAALYFPSFWTQ